MSVKNFIQTIWSKRILDELKRKCVLVNNCTTEYEGDCKYASTVKILSAGDPTIGIYTGEKINYEDMSDNSQDLVIDNQYYFAFLVHDVDEAQSVPGLRNKFQEKATDALAVTRDDYIGKLVAGKAQSSADAKAGNTTYKEGAETKITATERTQAGIKTVIDKAITKLRENNFSGGGVIEITPGVYNLFKNELVELKTDNDNLIRKGAVGEYDTYNVFYTNGIYKDTKNEYCIVRSKHAVAFAGQINEVEAGRHQDYFADYIRGLDTFGAKIIAQKELVVIAIPIATA